MDDIAAIFKAGMGKLSKPKDDKDGSTVTVREKDAAKEHMERVMPRPK